MRIPKKRAKELLAQLNRQIKKQCEDIEAELNKSQPSGSIVCSAFHNLNAYGEDAGEILGLLATIQVAGDDDAMADTACDRLIAALEKSLA